MIQKNKYVVDPLELILFFQIQGSLQLGGSNLILEHLDQAEANRLG
jgi:hypothetical protein